VSRDIKKIILEMTLEEKAGLCSGLNWWETKSIDRLGIPSIMMTDGPHGLRKQATSADHLGLNASIPATCFPSGAALACSWDRKLIEKVGVALGEECQAEKVDIILGPGANIKRSPLCGRNFEYFSEDPYLSAKMAAGHIKGVQSQGVGTSLKHYAVNNQEERRMSVDTIVDERTLREIYLASFEGAVKQSQPWTVMCSYNKVNGEYVSEKPYLLTDILKKEWGHEGFVVSDWGAVNQRVEGLAAGMELEMPSSHGSGDRKIVEAVKSGVLPESVLDQAVERILTIIFRAVDNRKEDAAYDRDAHHRLAREVAAECMVLLKNEANILPLKRQGTIAVIGAFAKNPRYQGGGSSHINPTRLDDICAEIGKEAGAGVDILYAEGYVPDNDDLNEGLIAAAQEAAARSDVAVVFAGLPDRWLDKVKGVLEVYLGGQALGGAIADVLFGNVNPSGKLAETFPKDLRHNPSYPNFPGEGDRVEYREGLFTGYRYYDTKKIEPLFPFGYGLSYTFFEYTGISIDKKEVSDRETVTVTVKVKNAGKVYGKEIIQLYVRDVKSSVIRPEKELKGFDKVALQPGEEKTVAFTLDKRAFAYYNAEIGDWHVESGDFEILVGSSSKDIFLWETVNVESSATLGKQYHRNTTIGDLMADPVGTEEAKKLIKYLTGEGGVLSSLGDNPEMATAMARFMPLRTVIAFCGGAFDEVMLDEMLQKLNR
jgi:beta-glucosidase